MCYNVRAKIASYHQPSYLSGKTVRYVMNNRNQRTNGQLEIVYADSSPVKTYGYQ